MDSGKPNIAKEIVHLLKKMTWENRTQNIHTLIIIDKWHASNFQE